MITKKEIRKNTNAERLPGFITKYKYTYRTERFDFGVYDTTLEIWDKKFDGDYCDYPGQYIFFDGNKKEFVEEVYNFLTNL